MVFQLIMTPPHFFEPLDLGYYLLTYLLHGAESFLRI